MDIEEKATIGGNIMEKLSPLAYELIEKNGPMPVLEALIWLASLIAVESDVPIEDFTVMARKCYKFNASVPAEERIH